MFEKITEAEINERSMANVSTTPNRPTAFGESRMDAQALKLRFDRFPRYLAGRLNEIFEALDEGNFAQAVYINHDGRKVNLETFITNLLTGDVDDIQIKTADGIVYLTELGNKVQEMYNGQYTGDLAGNITIVDGVTLKKFYEDFLKMEDQGQGEPGKSAYDYAVEGGYQGTEEEFAKKLATEYPSKVSQLENDEKYITALGAPVQTVNGKAGDVELYASDVGARPNTWMPSYSDVNADKAGTAQSLVSGHNTSTDSHNDIRLELQRLAGIIADVLDSDDVTLDEMHEIVAVIKANTTIIEAITTGKVNVTDIIDNLTTNVKDKPLSAAQGVALKLIVDDLSRDKLDASALASAINTALAQAKASGEFDGADGKTPYIQNGYWYIDGVNTNVKAEGKNGNDYVITDADYSQIAAIVLEMLGGEPIHGVVDENNHITLKGVDAGGKYTFSFVTEEGELIYGGEFVYDTNTYYEVTTPTLTNCRFDGSAIAIKGQGYEATITANDGYELSILTATMEGDGTITADKATGKISTDKVTGDIVITAVATATATVTPANFCVPNGDGWITNGRCSSSGEDRTNGVTGWHCSNYISVQNCDIVYVENADLCTLANQYCGMYKPDKTAIGGFMINNGAGYVKDVDLTSEVENFTINNANAGYVRVVLKPHSTNDDIVIKIKRKGTWLTA